MITGFEDITYELTDYERNNLMPVIIAGLRTKHGEQSAVDSRYICRTLKNKGFQITDARLRKIIHVIRRSGIIHNLIATSKGYYIATTIDELRAYEKSLDERIERITAIRDYITTCINSAT